MKIFKVNRKISIVCESLPTRNAFKHVATLMYQGNEVDSAKICYQSRTWERFEFESVLERIAENSRLSERETKIVKKFIKDYGKTPERDPMQKTTAMVAMMGEIFGTNQKEKNDWKARMLKAGLEGQGLIMPEDWDTLSEDEKTVRLDGVIKILQEGK